MPDSDFGVRRIVDRAAAAGGFQLEPVLSGNLFEVLIEFARGGGGVAILPVRAATREAARVGLVIIPLTDPALRATTIDVVVLRKRRLPHVVKVFAEMLIAEIAATS
jgi:DNA-binding transcriptional LysR family regulator